MAVVTVRVQPRSASERIGPYADGILALRVTRPAADGQANEAARRLLARALDAPPSTIRLVSGGRSRTKRFEASGLGEAELARRLARFGPPEN